MNDTSMKKHGGAYNDCAPSYGFWSLQKVAAGSRRGGPRAPAFLRGAGLDRFARQYLYRLIVSRLARAEVIMSGALTSIDVL